MVGKRGRCNSSVWLKNRQFVLWLLEHISLFNGLQYVYVIVYVTYVIVYLHVCVRGRVFILSTFLYFRTCVKNIKHIQTYTNECIHLSVQVCIVCVHCTECLWVSVCISLYTRQRERERAWERARGRERKRCTWQVSRSNNLHKILFFGNLVIIIRRNKDVCQWILCWC